MIRVGLAGRVRVMSGLLCLVLKVKVVRRRRRGGPCTRMRCGMVSGEDLYRNIRSMSSKEHRRWKEGIGLGRRRGLLSVGMRKLWVDDVGRVAGRGERESCEGSNDDHDDDE
jgi:hypothetical protein